VSPLLLVSLGASALSLLLLAPLALFGPLAAGVLAFLGYRQVRASGGRVRSAGLARVAMSAALGTLLLHAWLVVRYAPVAAAYAAMTRAAEDVRAALSTGTAESAWDLLGPEGHEAETREAFLARLRKAAARLGALADLGEAREAGGDWDRKDRYLGDPEAVLRLAVRFEARFERGPGRVEMEFLVRREGRGARAFLVALRVEPR